MHSLKVNLRMLKILRSYSPGYYLLCAFTSLFGQLQFYYNLWISAEIVTELSNSRDVQKIWFLVASALCVNLLLKLSTALLDYLSRKAHGLLLANEKAAFTKKLLSLDYAKLEDPEIRNLRRKVEENSYINNYGSNYFITHIRALMDILFNLAYSAFLFAEMISYAAKNGFDAAALLLGLSMCAAVAGRIILSNYGAKKTGEADKRLGDAMLEINRYSRGFPTSNSMGKDVRIYRLAPIGEELDRRAIDMQTKFFSEFWNTMFKYIDLPESGVNFLINTLSYLFTCYYCLAGVFPIGSVIKYVGYLNRFTGNAELLFENIFQLKYNTVFLEQYLEFFDIKNDMYQGSLSVEKRSDRKFDVEFKNVSFCYPGSDEFAIKNINFKFRVGEKLAVVGMNGSGKTTLIKLLCRLYDPTEGEIVMNDFNIRKYDYRQYLDLYSVVFQDYNLLAFSLGQNVAASPEFDKNRVKATLCDAGFGERLDTLSLGIETPLYKNFDADGVEISGGEAQKIALARALYRNSPFIILDEPTAALDPMAEAEIYSHFNDIVGGRTAIYISHRLSSCRFCDRILVLDRGEIVQYGTHEELLSDENGKYFELWNAQAQYYNEKNT